MKRNDRLLKATEQTLQEKAEGLLTLSKTAEGEDRELTEDEQTARETLRGEITELKARSEELKGKIEIDREIETLASGLKGEAETREIERRAPRSLGEQFIESDGYRSMIAKGLSGKWSSGMVELHPNATTLYESTSPAGAAALVPEQRLPGVMPILYERLTVASLIAAGQTTSNLIRYVVETVADNSAVGTVAEGAPKPEVALELDLVDEPVSKIAAFLPVSDETLEDASQIRSYIDARLSLFVVLEEEQQILNGTGSGTDLDGILNRIPAGNKNQRATGTGTNDADHIFAAMTTARESFLEPSGIVIHPDDWAGLRLLKDSQGGYIAGTPFSNAMGGQPAETLWGKPVVVTSAMSSGTALVGAFSTAAQVFRRGSLVVESSNSHSDYFRSNLTAVRAEERLGLAVYRPAAFATANLGAT